MGNVYSYIPTWDSLQALGACSLASTGQPHYNAIFGVLRHGPCYKKLCYSEAPYYRHTAKFSLGAKTGLLCSIENCITGMRVNSRYGTLTLWDDFFEQTKMADRRINNEDADIFLDVNRVYFHLGQT